MNRKYEWRETTVVNIHYPFVVISFLSRFDSNIVEHWSLRNSGAVGSQTLTSKNALCPLIQNPNARISGLDSAPAFVDLFSLKIHIIYVLLRRENRHQVKTSL